MTDNKTFIMSFILFCLCGCTNEATKNVHGEFLCVTDSKPYSDYLFTEWLKEGNAINPREIELQYVIHNYTVEKLYLPIQTWSDSTTHSSINVFFINKKDTIYPIYSIKKIPYKSNYICKGDSLIVFVKIYNFEKLIIDTPVNKFISFDTQNFSPWFTTVKNSHILQFL